MAAMTLLPAGYTAVDLSPDRLHDVLAVDMWAFPSSVTEEQMAQLPLPMPWSRAGGVETADGELVAMYAAYPYRSFPVPGARIPVAGLTWVGVHPGHRRRGLLRAMIHRHFAQAQEAGEAVAALFAAEPGIYGRFGYGLASRQMRMTIPRGAALRDVPGAETMRVRLEKLDRAKHGPVLHQVHSAVDRPGWATRETEGALEASLNDPEWGRDGAESLRIALVEDAQGNPRGYAKFRRKDAWQPEGPRGVVRVREVVAQDAATARALWGVLLDLDLMATVEVGMLALDDPLWFLLVDPRAAAPAISDNLWVRVLDVPTALAQRRYAAPVDVVLEVTDAQVPGNAGRWRLVGGPDGAEVTATTDAAHVALDVRELGSAYLGDQSLVAMAAAGLVTELVPGTLHAAATAFSWPTAPLSSYVW
jgi:predicted acetyltransferase